MTDNGVKIVGAAEPAVGDGRARVLAVRAQHPRELIELRAVDFEDEVVAGACVSARRDRPREPRWC